MHDIPAWLLTHSVPLYRLAKTLARSGADWIVITPTSFKKMLAELQTMNETVVPACLRQQAFFSI